MREANSRPLSLWHHHQQLVSQGVNTTCHRGQDKNPVSMAHAMATLTNQLHVLDSIWTGMKHVNFELGPGPWFNIKMSSYQYRKSHCGDKTVVRSSHLHNGISYTGKMTSLYWIRAQAQVITHFLIFTLKWHVFPRKGKLSSNSHVFSYKL